PGPRFHGHELSRRRAAVEPSVERGDLFVRMIVLVVAQVSGRPAEQRVADDVRRDDAVPLELGALGVVLGAQQGGVGDDDADLEAGAGSPWPWGPCGGVLCRGAVLRGAVCGNVL